MEALIPIFFFMSVAAVLILRPLTKRLGVLMEMLARERQTPVVLNGGVDATQLGRITNLLEHLNSRIDLMEDRVEFMERLTDPKPRERQRLTGT